MIKAILFDLSEVLIDTKGFFNTKSLYVQQAILKKFKANRSIEEIKKALNKSYLQAEKYWKKGVPFSFILCKELGLKFPEKKIIKMDKLFRDEFVKFISFNEEWRSLLTFFNRKFLLGIVSNYDEATVKKILKRFSLARFFKLIVGIDTTGYEKSKLVPFIYALKKLRVKPTEVLMIGDDEYEDIIPAKKLGILTIKIVRNMQEKTSANWKIKKLNEIFQIL